jgi:hypothetical protein
MSDAGPAFQIDKDQDSTLIISVVESDPDPQGSETFCRIRNWTLTLPKFITKISNLLIMTLKRVL